jgi:PhzF family phenazine biosynthesis protein
VNVPELARSVPMLDVFADGDGGGNPCPVMLDADDLPDEVMQEVTRLLGHESVFVLRPRDDEAAVRMRYFVPEHEMDMCVHATVAALTLLGSHDRVDPGPVRVETRLGLIDAAVETDGSVTVQQFEPTYGTALPQARADLAKVLGCAPAQLRDSPDQPASVSVSRSKLIVELDAAQTLHGLEIDPAGVRELCQDLDVTGLYPWAVGAPGEYVARQFPVNSGYPEDPATGLAAAALGAFLARREDEDGSFEYVIRQGQAMGRPSVLRALVTRDSGRVVRVGVNGRATQPS